MANRFLPLLLAVVLLGCSNDAAVPEVEQQPAAGQPKTLETVDFSIAADTAYYLGGPQQASPPDGTLRAGTQVKLVEQAGSYCRVRTDDGLEAYVSLDSLVPAKSKQ